MTFNLEKDETSWPEEEERSHNSDKLVNFQKIA